MNEWFRCLADVPGVDYIGDARVKGSLLPGYGTVPRLNAYTFEGERLESLLWPTANGQTSQSPASRHAGAASSPGPGDPLGAMLQCLYEVLELPGIASDYHFAIQGCIEELWKQRHQEPAILSEVARLCWLDIRLVEARPETITYEHGANVTYAGVSAFGQLVDLYSHEGFVSEALDVAERGARLHQKTPVVELRERVTHIATEEA